MRDLVFRRVTPHDAPALAACFERNDVPELTRHFSPFPLTAEQAYVLARSDRLDAYFGAFGSDGVVVGFSMLRGRDEGYEVPSLGIFVDRAEQGAGIGAWLLDETLAAADSAGAPAVRLSVYADNQGAQRLYRSRGFAESERATVRRADGSERVRIVMVRRRRPPTG